VKGFLKAGHTPTLVAALLYFDVSFMTWVLLGPLAPFLREELGLTSTQQGLLTAIPLLGGSLFRPVLGMLGDRLGGRRTGLLGLTLMMLTLAAGWQFARFPDRIGIVTGVVGAAGGLGGFFLPSLLGAVRDLTGSYGPGLVGCAAVFAVGTIVLLELGTHWTQRWDDSALRRAGIYCYREALRRVAGERAA
jgi:NNP family nitrate/nitrite transporter-like MFS transporter